MTPHININWIAAFNRLFQLLDREGPTYCSGPNFLKVAQQVEPGVPSYQQLIPLRQAQGKSTSRRDFYWDILQGFDEGPRLQLYRLFLDELARHAPEEVSAIRTVVFGGGEAVPTVTVPLDLWNSEKLNKTLRDIDHAIDARQFNRATALSYTCLEGLYKAYVRRNVPGQAYLADLIPLCKVVKEDIAERLRNRGPFPEQIVNAIPTLTHAVANSRNGFSEAHFADDSHMWLAVFARDMTNSIGRLLLHFL